MGRYALLIGTGRHADPTLTRLRSPVADLQQLTQALRDPGIGAFDAVQVCEDRSALDLKRAIEDFTLHRGQDDFLLIYLSCHGVADPQGRYYFAATDTELARLGSSTVEAWFLDQRLQDSRAGTRLLLLDCCLSGSFTVHTQRPIAVDAGLLGLTPRNYEVITACDRHEYALDGNQIDEDRAAPSIFTEVLLEALVDPAADTDHDGWISTHELSDYLDHRVHIRSGGTQRPRYKCDIHHPARVARRPTRLTADPAFFGHWEPRGRGVPDSAQAGWYFSGRTTVLRDIVSWLGGHGDAGARVVTGMPGSGKSAVLARIVTLAEPDYRRQIPNHVLDAAADGTVPEPGSIDAAIHAQGKTANEIARQIAVALGLTAGKTSRSEPRKVLDNPKDVREALTRLPGGAVIVIDALDEAIDPEALVDTLIRPLIDRRSKTTVRLLIATKPPVPTALRNAAVIDLDKVDLKPDITEYAEALLLGASAPSPYRDKPKDAALAARAVGAHSAGNFLIAQLIATALTMRDEQAGPAELATFPDDVPAAMHTYLAETAHRMHSRQLPTAPTVEAGKRWLIDMLTPLAFARGEGLADEAVWAEVSSAIGVRRYTEYDVRQLRESPALYLLRGRQSRDGEVTWSLFHQALSAAITDPRDLAVRFHGGPRRVHGAFAKALVGRVETSRAGEPALDGRDWAAADRYTLSHLAEHAAEAGQADLMVEDLEFLVHADPARIEPLLAGCRSKSARLISRIYRSSGGSQEASASPAIRRQLLMLSGAQHGEDGLATRIADAAGSDPLRWRVRWASGHRQVGHQGRTYYTAYAEANNRPIVVTATVDIDDELAPGQAIVWDLSTGEKLHELVGHGERLWGLECVAVDGAALAVTVSEDWTARVWDLDSGACRHVFEEHSDAVRRVRCTELHGRTVAITCSDDYAVMIWDLRSGERLDTLSGHTDPIYGIAVSETAGQPVLITGSNDETARVWELTSEETGAADRWSAQPGAPQLGRPAGPGGAGSGGLAVRSELHTLIGHTDAVYHVGVTHLPDQTPVTVTTSRDATAIVWDLVTGEPLRTLTEEEPLIRLACARHHDGRTVAVTIGEDPTARLWDLSTGECLSRLVGHTSEVYGVSTALLHDVQVAATASSDGTVRLWDLGTGEALDVLAFPAGCWSVEFAPDGALVVGFGPDVAVLETAEPWLT